jgi:EAL domain-containing protein (putative c-di-GMP-specific phosphodiesterase class I)
MRAPTEPQIRVLLVEPDDHLRAEYSAALSDGGVEVVAAASEDSALIHLVAATYDVVVAEIGAHTSASAEFLDAVHAHDHDLPVIVMTNAPALESAVRAVNLGAYRYLVKPVRAGDLADLVRRAARRHSLARLRHAALTAVDREDQLLRALDARFTQAVQALWMAYQPIVATTGRFLLGFEALLRSDHGGFPSPEHLIGAAVRLERTMELGRAVRARVARDVARLPRDAVVFVNLLPVDLLDGELFARAAALSQFASRVVLELTERDSFDVVPDLGHRVTALRALGFRIALDDLGAGSSGLTSLTELKPDIVKLDRSLIRNVHLSAHRQAVVRSVVALCRSLNIGVIGEGVEGTAEEEALRGLEVEHLQGFLIAAPAREARRPVQTLH